MFSVTALDLGERRFSWGRRSLHLRGPFLLGTAIARGTIVVSRWDVAVNPDLCGGLPARPLSKRLLSAPWAGLPW